MAMTLVTLPMPGHPDPRFGIGAIPIKGITLRCPNARFRGERLFNKARTFQSDRQRLPMLYPAVRPSPSIDRNIYPSL